MAKAGKAGKSRSPARRKQGALDLGKFLEEVKFGNFKLDDVLEGTNKNLQAIADANRAIVDGYVDIAKRQFDMLRDLLDDLKKVGAERSSVAKELRKVVEQARRDVKALQKMASKTNAAAQKIVKRRSDANLKAWKKLVAEARAALGGKVATPGKASPKKAAAKRPAAKKKTAAKKKPAARKRPAARPKAAASAG